MADDPLEQVIDSFGEAVMRGRPTLTAEDLSRETGVDAVLAHRLWRAMGFPDVPSDEPAFYQADLDALHHADELIREVGLDPTDVLHLTRTEGLAAARMADAVVDFWMDRAGDTAASVDEGPWLAGEPIERRIENLEYMVVYLVRRHLLDSATRRITSSLKTETGGIIAVGFADLVGFTSLSEQLSDRETAELIERFEVLATDQIVGGGGRVIKMIGDEVMFSADPSVVAEIAVSLSETFDSPDLPSVRVGVAAGNVLVQSGDLYGPVVNLASRATVAARPGTVLVSPALADILRDDPRYRLTWLRPHRLKGIGIVQLQVLRRAKPASEGTSRAVAAARRAFTTRAG